MTTYQEASVADMPGSLEGSDEDRIPTGAGGDKTSLTPQPSTYHLHVGICVCAVSGCVYIPTACVSVYSILDSSI